MTKTYDDASRLLTLNNANSALTYTYDFAGQLTGETQNVTGLGAKTVAYTYDGDGNRATLTYPGGKVAAYSYTGRNQVDTITYDGPPPLVNYDYDLAGNRTVKTLENSTRAVSTYDDASRLTALDAQRSSGGVWTSLQSFAYTLNSVGNRTDRYETNAGLTKRDKYSYLADDQLDIVKYNYTGTTQDRTVDYNYDAAGNRTAVSDSAGQSIATYTTNSLNQYSTLGGQTENYDSNGNIFYGAGTGNVIYNHDAQNHVVGTSGGNSYTLAYDARNRCVKRVSGYLTTYLLWDGWSLIAEWTTGYTSSYSYIPLGEARRYVHGAAVDEILLAIAPAAAQTVHHVHDALGNVTALTDASGSVVERYTYDVFGQTTIRNASGTVLTASAYGNRFMFTGREWIAELNVYDYRNRMYAPGMGRFLETDPIGFLSKDMNLYEYVQNDPVDLIDPLGLSPLLDAFDKLGIEGAKEAVGKTNNDNERREFCGLICCKNGKSTRTGSHAGPHIAHHRDSQTGLMENDGGGQCNPHKDGDKGGAGAAVKCPEGAEEVGVFHSHPAQEGNETFSPEDKELPRKDSPRNYMSATTSPNKVQVWDSRNNGKPGPTTVAK